MTPDPALSVHDLGVTFGSRSALAGVTFDVPAGTIVGVIGPNGAGKSTLFRAILGLIPHSGTIALDGRAAYVPQGDANSTDFPVSAADVVMMGRYHTRRWWQTMAAADRTAVTAALAAMGMSGHRDCTFAELSGGQRQRVMFARALAQERRVLLLDEPFTGVDTASATLLERAIARLRDDGCTILISTHDLAGAAATCDRLLLLNRSVVAYGPPEEAFTAEAIQRTYEGAMLVVRQADGQPVALFDDAGHHHGHDEGSHRHEHPVEHDHRRSPR